MTVRIALFRGINVGGRHLLPMKELKQLLEGLGLSDVRTYIQSGNAVFSDTGRGAAALAETISAAVSEHCGFRPALMLLTRTGLSRAVAANPFPEATTDASRLHAMFLSAVPRNPDLQTLDALKSAKERFALKGRVFYLHTPDGLARSRLATHIEKALGVSGTMRNWRTVTRLLAMAEAGAGHAA